MIALGALAFARYDSARPARPSQRSSAAAPSAPGTLSAPSSLSTAPPVAERGAVSAEVALLREEVRRRPADLAARTRLAALLDEQGNGSEAEDVLREALRRGQKTPAVFHALGVLYLHNEQFTGAVEAFSAETRLNPKSFPAHLNLAQSYAYLQRADEAQKAFERARALDPSAPDVYLGLAFLNNTDDRYPRAVRYLEEYIRRGGPPGPGHALLSRVYLNMRQYDKAMAAGRKATAEMPTNENVWYNLGQAFLHRPNPLLSEAAHALEQAVQLSPNWGHAHAELGYAYTRQNRPADAITQYREAVRCEPSYGRYRYQLGRLLLQQNQAAEGRQELAKAQAVIALNQRASKLEDKITVSPRDVRSLFELGQLYRQLGDPARARQWFRATLQVAPDHPGAAEALDAASGTPQRAAAADTSGAPSP